MQGQLRYSILGVLIFLCLSACQSKESPVPQDVEKALAEDFLSLEHFKKPQPLPKFTYLSVNGEILDSQGLKGRPVLLNFWATWCAPCVKELPLLRALDEAYPEMRVLAISLDPGQSIDRVSAFIEKQNPGSFAAYWDHRKEIKNGIEMRGIPTTLLIDEKGKIRYKFEGDADWMSLESKAFFDYFLKQK